MSSDRYPLKEVLMIKHKRLEESERVLKEKRELLAKEEEKMKAVQKEFDEAKELRDAKLQQLRDTLDEGTTTDKIQMMKQYLKIVEEKLKQKELKLKEQQKQVDIAKNNVEVARVDYINKQHDVEKLKIHKGEWTKEEMKELLRQEQNLEEEIGTSSFVRKKKNNEAPKKKE